MANGKELRVALTDVPDRLNPYQSNTLHIHMVMWPIYEPLFDIGSDGKWIPRLAQNWSPSANGLTYVFELRQGVTFNPGDIAFNAHSVVNSLRQRNNRATFRERILDDLIERVEVLDTHKVRIQLKYPKPELLFLALMTHQTGAKEPPLGTGPFCLQARDDSGFVLSKNPSYGPPAANLDRIVFKKIEPAVLMAEFAAGRVDFIRDVSPEQVPKPHDDRVQEVKPFGLHYLGFNMGSTLFKDRDVRRAFRDSIAFDKIAHKTELIPAKGPIPSRVEAYDDTLATPGQSRPDARKALEMACRRKTVKLLFNKNSYYGKELADRIKEDLDESNVAVELAPYNSSSDLLKAISERGHGKDDHYVFIYNWYSILPAAEIFLRPLFESGMPDNLTGYSNKGVDDSLAAAREAKLSTQDQIVRYRAAQKLIVDDVPAIFLGYSDTRYSLHNERVSGLERNERLNVQSFPVDRYRGVDVRNHP